METAALTRGSIPPQLVSLALPLIFGNILQQLYNTIDAMVIGRFAGETAFAAIGVAGTVMNLFLFLLSGCCTGISVLFAQQYGSRDLAGFRQEGFLASVFGGLFTLVLSLAALLLLRPLLTLMQTPEDVARLADRLVVVSGGRIPFSGPPREVFAHGDELEAMGLGVPQVTRVFHRLKAMGRRLPASLILMSPWTDMTASGKSYRERRDADPMITMNYIQAVRQVYAREADLTSPLLSPLFGDLSRFPPALIQVGTNEILYSDSIRLRERMLADNVHCQLEVWNDMWHVFQMSPFKTAYDAMDKIAEFIFDICR